MLRVLQNQIPLSPENPVRTKKVLVINACSPDLDPQGSLETTRSKNFLRDEFLKGDDLSSTEAPDFDVVDLPDENRVLSADQNEDYWVALAQVIESYFEQYAGFVIISGTETMVMTASALSFMLYNLGKPVVFTGSIIPADSNYTDLRRNVIVALRVALSEVSEVCILFDEKLFRANRTIWVASSPMCVFDSPFLPELAVVKETLKIRRSVLRPYPRGKLQVFTNMHTKVLMLQLVPGLEPAVLLKFFEKTNARAIILCCYGSGNGPTREANFRRLLQVAKDRDILVVICTQNRYGIVKLEEYEGGRQIMEDGGVGAEHMTHETVLVKLKYLFGKGCSTQAVRDQLLIDMRGELNPLITHL